MTRSQLITKVAGDTGMSASAVEKVMDGIFGTIGDVLREGDKVTIAGFGRFEMRERQTKNFTNAKTPPPGPGGGGVLHAGFAQKKSPRGCPGRCAAAQGQPASVSYNLM